MIVWIASFPKSGNTWLRAFLCSYIYMNSDDKNFDFELFKNILRFPSTKQYKDIGVEPKNFEEVAKHWIDVQKKINSNNKINFLKTHNAYGGLKNFEFTDKKNTIGAIYLVRDPRDVLVSYARHLEISIDKTLELVLEDNHTGWLNQYKKDVIGEIRGNWAQNYNSWKNFYLAEKIIIKYEDLISDPFNTFSNVIKYLNKLFGLEIDNEKIKKCIEITDFNKLKKLEIKSGFVENYNKKEPFFNIGKSDQWQNILDEKIISKLEQKFNREMRELKYI
tara:strand:- start:86 stop:916 length:831 start_codon:yes stop_codon:yes gene_type:complete